MLSEIDQISVLLFLKAMYQSHRGNWKTAQLYGTIALILSIINMIFVFSIALTVLGSVLGTVYRYY